VRYYHRTDAAAEILRDGFRDSTGSYMLATTVLTGVFISDLILDVNEGARGDDVIEVDIPQDVNLTAYEIVEELKGYREWCVPAALLNDPTVRLRLLTQDEIDETELQQSQRFM